MWSAKSVTKITKASEEYDWDGETLFDHNELLSACPSLAYVDEITEESEAAKRSGPKSGAQTPAEPSERKKGSKKNKRLNKQLEDIGNEVLKFKYKFMRENPSIFFVKLLKAMEPVHIPKAKKKENGEIDENFQYNYYKTHYWDHYDLSDERIIRTPIFHDKMVSYLKQT